MPAALVLLAAAAAGAAEPPTQPPRTDLYGDPLPPGALARLGTVRFRHAGIIRAAYAPDGKTLVSAGDGTLRRFDADTGKQLQRWPTCDSDLACAAFSLNRRVLAVAGSRRICLYDTTTGAELRQLDLGEEGPVHSLAFSPDGELLASKRPFDAVVALWDVRTGTPRRELKPAGYDDLDFGSGAVLCEEDLAFSLDGKYLACASEDGAARLWQVATGREVRQHPAASHTPRAVAFSPDGKVLAWSGRGHIRRAEVTTGKELSPLPVGEGSPSRLVFSPDGKVLASLGSVEDVRLWDVSRGKTLSRLAGDFWAVNDIAFSPDGKTLAAVLPSRIGRWDVATGKELPAPGGSQGPVYDLVLSPDGRTVAVADYGPTVRLWDRATGKQRHERAGDGFISFTFARDGKTLALATDQDTLRLLDVASGKEVRCFHVPPVGLRGIAYSADGTTIALATGEGGAVLEAATGTKVHEVRTRPLGKPLSLLAFAGDGSVLVLQQGPLVLSWDVATGRQYAPCRVADEEIEKAVLSPDSKTLALWVLRQEKKGRRPVGPLPGSGRLVLYEVATGRERCRFGVADELALDPRFAALAFSPDGELLALLMDDRIRFWDVSAGREIGQIRTAQDGSSCFAFAADGKSLASGGMDSTVLLWDLAPFRKPGPRASPNDRAPGDLESLWSDLAGENAARAYRAVLALAASPGAVPFLADRLRQAAREEATRRQRIPRLLDDLDRDEFAVRQAAAGELEGLADLAEPALRRALEAPPSAEVRRQIGRLLDRREGAPPGGEMLRVRRAVEALERLATPEAREALRTLAEGEPEARLPREAKASLGRLARQPPPER